MKSTRSIQKTLGTGLTIGVTLLWLLALLGAVYVAQSKLNDLFDSALAEAAERLMPLAIVEITNREGPEKTQQIVSFKDDDQQIVYLIRDKTGNILLQSHNADRTIFNQPFLNGFSSSTTYRFYGASAIQNTLHIEIAQPLTQRREAVLGIAIALLWPLALLIPFCFFGSLTFVRYSLRHVLAYRDEIESRGKANLSPVSVKDLPSEIWTIAQSVNNLLDRLRRALEAERAFTANSAHELRTPIATALAQIQRLQQEVSSEPIKDKIVKIEATIKKLSNLSEKLMQLAKAEGGGLLSNEQHDLLSLLRLIVKDTQRSFPTRIITLIAPPNEEFKSSIDPDAFAILVRNLLDNAIKHGEKDQPIEISLSSDGILSIINACNIISSETLAQLRQRFVRSNISVQGLGLGLAIVEAIVTGVGATMTFNSPATGRDSGFEVCINFSVININLK